MPKILSNSISYSLNSQKQYIYFRLNFSLVSETSNPIQINDEIRIFYSIFDASSNSWQSEQLIKSPYSYKAQITKSVNLTDTFISNVGGRYKFRLALYRNNIEILSVDHKFKFRNRQYSEDYIDTSYSVKAPSNIIFNNATISWDHYPSYHDLPIKHFVLVASYSKALSIERIVSSSTRQYTFSNLLPGSVIFYIYAVDIANNKSTKKIVNNIPYKIISNNYELFDKTSWANKINNSKLKNCLDQASTRWNNFIKFSSKSFDAIQKSFEFKSKYNDQFKGIRLKEITIQNMPDALARCGPSSIIDLGNNQYNTIDFVLIINPYLLNYSDTGIVNTLTHELGHALGIGVYWTINNDSTEFPYSLNGDNIIYSKCQKAYKQFMLKKYPPGSLWEDLLPVPLPKNPKYIPLNFDGIGAGSHFSDLLNTTNSLSIQYPDLSDDIMSYGNTYKITPVSINFLVDIGYEEKNPGSSEYDGETFFTLQSPSEPISCDIRDMPKPVIAVDLSDKSTIIYDENISVNDPCETTLPTPSVTPLILNNYA